MNPINSLNSGWKYLSNTDVKDLLKKISKWYQKIIIKRKITEKQRKITDPTVVKHTNHLRRGISNIREEKKTLKSN